MEIDYDTVRSMSDAELADRYDAVTGQISESCQPTLNNGNCTMEGKKEN